MSPESKSRIEKYRVYYNHLVNDGVMMLPAEGRNEVYEVLKKEIPGYSVMLWCGHCVAEMLKFAFKKIDE